MRRAIVSYPFMMFTILLVLFVTWSYFSDWGVKVDKNPLDDSYIISDYVSFSKA